MSIAEYVEFTAQEHARYGGMMRADHLRSQLTQAMGSVEGRLRVATSIGIVLKHHMRNRNASGIQRETILAKKLLNVIPAGETSAPPYQQLRSFCQG